MAALAFAVALPDAAAIPRTFVASFGSDAQPCTLALPCRGFTVALAATDPGGEIVVLDSAGYGQVTIGKSVSITVPAGVYAGISVLSGNGITVSGAGINVVLSGLTINGQGGVHGIRFVQGARLNVDNCQIVAMGGNGLRVEGAGTVVVTGTAIRRSGQAGVFVNAAANVTIVRSRIQSSGSDGIAMSGGASGSVARTLIADNGLFGVVASQTSAGTTRIALNDATITDNDMGTGVYAEATAASAIARVDVTNSLVTRNFNGLYAFAQPGGTAADERDGQRRRRELAGRHHDGRGRRHGIGAHVAQRRLPQPASPGSCSRAERCRRPAERRARRRPTRTTCATTTSPTTSAPAPSPIASADVVSIAREA